ncbi:ferritin family protein [Ramlibacter sp.]|uniref:ferritin-like domain-containing protein n=1 Tax=Ramlibacter sp. TaxID=1917967 RepID=UPI002C700FF9|nr:ferritin family protein [Ramlibacter sp.]HWI83981.1 ferritin family protein [Ramlibacter sp.]
MNRAAQPSPMPLTLEEFMAQALAMEREAVDRYSDFADMLETHNNQEVADLFRTMAGYEAKHAQQIMQEMGWTQPPPPPPGMPHTMPGMEAPEAMPLDEVHYLMQPWHALQLALAAEKRAQSFFAVLARMATTDAVRRAALELQAEEAGHVALVQEWLDKVPAPDQDWAVDPDPPRYTD